MRKAKPIVDRFMSYVMPVPESGCWLWIGAINNKGYGRFSAVTHGKSTRYAHRISFELFNGSIPHGMCALHKCDVACCVNPKHLFIGTVTDNNQDMMKKGRYKGYYGAARNRTHCKNGHELVYRTDKTRGLRRFCKTCNSKYGSN